MDTVGPLALITALGIKLPIAWIGIAEDGSLRFEVLSDDMITQLMTFTDPRQTSSLTYVWYGDKKVFEGYTTLKGIENMGTGIVVRLTKKADKS